MIRRSVGVTAPQTDWGPAQGWEGAASALTWHPLGVGLQTHAARSRGLSDLASRGSLKLLIQYNENLREGRAPKARCFVTSWRDEVGREVGSGWRGHMDALWPIHVE